MDGSGKSIMARVLHSSYRSGALDCTCMYSGKKPQPGSKLCVRHLSSRGCPYMWTAQERAKMAHVFYIPQTEVEP